MIPAGAEAEKNIKNAMQLRKGEYLK